MTRYIDADAIKWHEVEWAHGKRNDKIIACEIAVDETPTADVKKVVHAHWEDVVFYDGSYASRCSFCNTTWDAETRYCPNCGAKMDEEIEND